MSFAAMLALLASGGTARKSSWPEGYSIRTGAPRDNEPTAYAFPGGVTIPDPGPLEMVCPDGQVLVWGVSPEDLTAEWEAAPA